MNPPTDRRSKNNKKFKNHSFLNAKDKADKSKPFPFTRVHVIEPLPLASATECCMLTSAKGLFIIYGCLTKTLKKIKFKQNSHEL